MTATATRDISRENYIRVANGLARAARDLKPLLDEARLLQQDVSDRQAQNWTADDDERLELHREAIGSNTLDCVLFAFGQIFDNMPLVENLLHCTSGNPEVLEVEHTV